MSKLAIDVNVVLTWMELQSPELFEPANELFRKMKSGEVVVYAPEFLLVELVNVLKWRYKRNKEESAELVRRTRESNIKFVAVGAEKMEEINRLMHEYDLTAYDALYLLVAQKMGCKLVTVDPKLLEVRGWCVKLL